MESDLEIEELNDRIKRYPADVELYESRADWLFLRGRDCPERVLADLRRVVKIKSSGVCWAKIAIMQLFQDDSSWRASAAKAGKLRMSDEEAEYCSSYLYGYLRGTNRQDELSKILQIIREVGTPSARFSASFDLANLRRHQGSYAQGYLAL